MEGKYGLLGRSWGTATPPPSTPCWGTTTTSSTSCRRTSWTSFSPDRDFAGLNVTIPYKKAVIPYCAELSPMRGASWAA